MPDLTTKIPETTPYFDPNYTIPGKHASCRKTEEPESGESTPPLWRMSPTRVHSQYQSLSPASKAQAIARGQRELMDMVRTMPEGCFELSLRDLVEKPWARPVDQNLNRVQDLGPKEEIVMKKRSDQSNGNANIARSSSLDRGRGGGGGFLLKMVFPVPVGSGKGKRKSKNSKNIPARSESNPASVESKASRKACGSKNEETDWWRRKIPILEESESSRSTTKSSSRSSTGTSGSGRRNNISRSSSWHGRPSLTFCCFFSRPKKSHEHQEPRINGLQEL